MILSNWEILARLMLALAFGGLIGLERESHGRPAGFRTHILVALGSTLVMIISVHGFSSFAQGARLNYDPGRLAAQVVSGIGFLGAGTIMREGTTVRGLTTAASLWVVAGIGMAVGTGAYFPAAVTTLLVMVTLLYLSRLEQRFLSTKRQILVLEISDEPGQLGAIGSVLGHFGINIRGVEMDTESQPTVMELSLELPSKVDRLTMVDEIASVPGVISARVKS